MCLQLGIFPRGHLCAAVSRDTLSTRTLTSPALPSRVHSSRAPDGRATRPIHTARWLATQEPSQHGQGRKRGAHRAPRWREASQHVTPEDPKVPRDLSTGGPPRFEDCGGRGGRQSVRGLGQWGPQSVTVLKTNPAAQKWAPLCNADDHHRGPTECT